MQQSIAAGSQELFDDLQLAHLVEPPTQSDAVGDFPLRWASTGSSSSTMWGLADRAWLDSVLRMRRIQEQGSRPDRIGSTSISLRGAM